MAPVNPTNLLDAFKPLLTVCGGIKSLSDVPRLSQLMKRYSKKLVSRCVYCNILLATTPDVLLSFLELDGWNLINAWLKDSLSGDNYRFICELLDLLARCPMTLERLRQNDTPKLVKSLSKNSDQEVVSRAKLVVSKWTELIKPNENVNNGNVAKKKRKKEKSSEDEADPAKIRKVKGIGVLQQASNNNDVVNSSSDDVTTKSKTTAEDVATIESLGFSNRPRTAKVSFGKSRSVGVLEDTNSTSGKSKGSKRGDDDSPKSGPGKQSNNNNLNNNSVPVSSSGPAQSKTVGSSKSSKPILKESVGFIADITSFTGNVRKRRKSDAKSKSSSGNINTNASKEPAPDSSSQGDEPGATQEPMDTNDDLSDEMEEITGSVGDESNINSNSNDADKQLPIVDVPELDNLVIPEIEPSKLPRVTKSILNFGKQTGRMKKSVRWRSDERLKEIKFFELDETERTNVSKANFGDFRANDIRNERQMLQQIRNNRVAPTASGSSVGVPAAEKCITYLPWKLTLIDLPRDLPLIEAGCQSEERRARAVQHNNAFNAEFFPVNQNPNEYNPKEPDLVEPIVERNDRPTVIPLEDENFTVTDYSTLPPPAPRTGEIYPARGPPVGPAAYQQPGMGGGRPPAGPMPPRAPFPPGGFGAPVPGYGPPYQGPGYVPPGGPRGPMMPPRPPMGPGGVPMGPMAPGFAGPGWGAPRPPRPPPVCRYFLKSGSCRFMARCNYLHQYPNTNNPHGSGSSSNQSHME